MTDLQTILKELRELYPNLSGKVLLAKALKELENRSKKIKKSKVEKASKVRRK